MSGGITVRHRHLLLREMSPTSALKRRLQPLHFRVGGFRRWKALDFLWSLLVSSVSLLVFSKDSFSVDCLYAICTLDVRRRKLFERESINGEMFPYIRRHWRSSTFPSACNGSYVGSKETSAATAW